jgi:protein-disulfide isomerase
MSNSLRLGSGLAGLLMSAAFVLPAIAQAPLADKAVLTRFHSPTFGDPAAKVEIVEFFDPACEACRAMYPFVKKLLEEHRGRVRLTLRYVPFHKGADEVVRLLEAARRQGKYPETLETLMASQSRWAVNHVARVDLALRAVEGLNLDMARLKADMAAPDLNRLLKQDMDDAKSLKVTRTPEFFVNRRPLTELGYEELRALVVQEIRNSYGPSAQR